MQKHLSVLLLPGFAQSNDVVNPGAETTDGWNVEKGVWNRTKWDPVEDENNKYHFSGGSPGLNVQSQWINYTTHADNFDNYQRIFILGALFGGREGHTDTGKVLYECYGEDKDTSEPPLGYVSLGPWTAGDHVSQGIAEMQQIAWTPPPGTRHVKVTMTHNSVESFTVIDHVTLLSYKYNIWQYVWLIANPDCELASAESWWNAIGDSKQLRRELCVNLADQGLTSCLGKSRLFIGGHGPESESPYQQSQYIQVGYDRDVIDERGMDMYMSAMLGGLGDREDYGEVLYEMFDEEDEKTGPDVMLKPVTASERNGESKFLHRELRVTLPVGTRKLRVTMKSVRGENSPGTETTTGLLDDIHAILVPNAERDGCSTETVLWLAIDVAHDSSDTTEADNNFETMVNGYAAALEEVIPPRFGKIAVCVSAYAAHQGRSGIVFKMQRIQSEISLRKLTKAVRGLAPGRADISPDHRDLGDMLDIMIMNWYHWPNGFTHCKSAVAIVLSTGVSHRGPQPAFAAKLGVSVGIHPNCLGVTSENDCAFTDVTGGYKTIAPTVDDVEETMIAHFDELIKPTGTSRWGDDAAADDSTGVSMVTILGVVVALLACGAIGAVVWKRQKDSSGNPLAADQDAAQYGSLSERAFGEIPDLDGVALPDPHPEEAYLHHANEAVVPASADAYGAGPALPEA